MVIQDSESPFWDQLSNNTNTNFTHKLIVTAPPVVFYFLTLQAPVVLGGVLALWLFVYLFLLNNSAGQNSPENPEKLRVSK